MPPDYGPFGAPASHAPRNLAALARLAAGGIVNIADAPTLAPPGLRVVTQGVLNQMIAPEIVAAPCDDLVLALGEADAAEILALATLTKPGPFAARTHQLGDFFGVRIGGALAAMTGERMKLPGFTEVSAVCVHPDHRGKGYGAYLTAHVAARIQARGETPFLHVFPDNQPAIEAYLSLGFVLRRSMALTVLAPEKV